MNPFPVSSTVLAAWDFDRMQLRLRFTDGTLYAYDHVPATLVEALLQSASPGRFFNHHIRGHFPARRIAPSLS